MRDVRLEKALAETNKELSSAQAELGDPTMTALRKEFKQIQTELARIRGQINAF